MHLLYPTLFENMNTHSSEGTFFFQDAVSTCFAELLKQYGKVATFVLKMLEANVPDTEPFGEEAHIFLRAIESRLPQAFHQGDRENTLRQNVQRRFRPLRVSRSMGPFRDKKKSTVAGRVLDKLAARILSDFPEELLVFGADQTQVAKEVSPITHFH